MTTTRQTYNEIVAELQRALRDDAVGDLFEAGGSIRRAQVLLGQWRRSVNDRMAATIKDDVVPPWERAE
jgi:hypothetical protein